jgi:Skp family chaperone for outer membrane proteins
MVRALRTARMAGWALPFAAVMGLVGVALAGGAGPASSAASDRAAARPAMAATGLVVAVVDTSRVLQGSAEWRDSVEERTRLTDNRKRSLSKLVRQIQGLRNDHDNLPPGSEERQKKAAEIQQVMAELERTQQQFQAESAREEGDATRAILTRVNQVVSDYAREHDVDLVLKKTDLSAAGLTAQGAQMLMVTADVLYANPDLDISEGVIEELNAGYKAPIQVK